MRLLVRDCQGASGTSSSRRIRFAPDLPQCTKALAVDCRTAQCVSQHVTNTLKSGSMQRFLDEASRIIRSATVISWLSIARCLVLQYAACGVLTRHAQAIAFRRPYRGATGLHRLLKVCVVRQPN